MVPATRPAPRRFVREAAFLLGVVLLGLWLARDLMAAWLVQSWARTRLNGSLRITGLELGWTHATLHDVDLVSAHGDKVLQTGAVHVTWSGGQLRSIDVHNPILHIVRTGANEWNVQGLLKPPPPSAVPWWNRFWANVSIEDGSVVFHDSTRQDFEAVIQHLDAHLDNSPQAMVFNLHAPDGRLTGRLDRQQSRYEASARVAAVNLDQWGNYALPQVPWVVDRGTAEATLNLWGRLDGSAPDVLVQGAVHGVALQIIKTPAPVTDLSGTFQATRDWLQFNDVTARLGPAALALQGGLTDFAAPSWDVTVSTRAPLAVSDVYRFLNRPPLPGLSARVQASLRLVGPPAHPRLDWQASAPQVTWQGQAFKQAEADGSWAAGLVRVDAARVQVGSGTAGASGWILPDQTMWLDVTAHRAALRPLAALLHGAVPGNASVDLHLHVVGPPTDLYLSGRAGLHDAAFSGVNVQQAAADFAYRGGTVFLSHGDVRSDHGDFRVPTAWLDWPQRAWLVRLEAQGLRFPTVKAGVWGHLDGRLDGAVTVMDKGGRGPVAVGMVSGGEVSLGRLRFTNVQAPLWLSPRLAMTTLGQARYETRPVWFSGASLLPPHFMLDLGLYVPDTPLPEVQRDLPFKFPFKMAGHGPAWIDVDGGPDDGVGWDITTQPDTGTFLTQGFVAPRDYGLTAYVLGHNADVRRLAPDFAWKYQPEGRADVQVVINSVGDQLDAEYSFQGHGLKVDGVHVANGTGGLFNEPDRLHVRDNFFMGPTMDLALRGDRTDNRVDLDLNATDIDLARAWRELDLTRWDVPVHAMDPYFDVQTLRGLGRVKGRLAGPVDDPTFTGLADIPRGSIDGETFSLGSHIRLDKSHLETYDARFQRRYSRMEAHGQVFFTQPQRYDLQVSTHNAEAADLLAGLRSTVPATGTVDGQVHVTGTSENPLLTGTVNVDHPTVYGQSFTSLAAVFKSGAHRLRLQSLHGVIGGGSLELEGILGPLSQLNLAFRMTDLDLRALSVLDILGPRQGTLSGRGQLSGSAKTVKGSLDVTGAGVELHGHPFHTVHLSSTFSPQAVTLQPLTMSGPSGAVTVTGQVDLLGGYAHPSKAHLDLETQTSNLDLGLFAPFWPVKVAGTLRGHTHVTGPWQTPDVTFDLAAQDMQLGSTTLGTVATAGLWAGGWPPRELRLDSLTFQGPDSSGSVAGRWAPGQALHGQVHLRNLDVSSLPLGMKLQGRLGLDATVASQDARPELHSTVHVQGGALGGYSFDTLRGQVDLSQGVLHLGDLQAGDAKNSLRLSGTIPLTWEAGGPRSTAPMSLKATVDESDLSLLTLFLPHVSSTTGTLRGTVAVGGTLAAPVLDGGLQIADGSLKFDFLATPLDTLQMDASLGGGQLKLQRLSGRMGDGTLQIAGFAELDRVFDPLLHFQGHGSKLLVDLPKTYLGRADADVSLQGRLDHPALSGTVSLRDGNLLVSEDLQGATKPATPVAGLPPVKVNLAMNLQDDVYLKFFGSSIRTRGQLNLSGTAPDVRPTGELKTVGGSINLPFLGLFKVDEGKVLFDGTSFLPFLDVTAESAIGSYQVFLHWQGDLKNPPKQPVTLSSNPPLSESDIMKLMQGRPPVEGGPALAGPPVNPFNNVLANLGSAAVVQPLLEAVGKVFALSDVALETTQPNFYSVKLARALDQSDKWFFTVTRIFGNAGEQEQTLSLYGIEYHPRVGVLIRAATGDLGAYSFLLQFSRHY